jgi:hypothetical protein
MAIRAKGNGRSKRRLGDEGKNLLIRELKLRMVALLPGLPNLNPVSA